MKKERFACLCFRFGHTTQGYSFNIGTRGQLKGYDSNVIVLFDVRNKPLKTKKNKEHHFVNEFCFL